MPHDHADVDELDEMDEMDAVDFWEQRYLEKDQIWSGSVNPVLAAEAGRLTPGRALDLGCGEGGDAIWLAAQGWTVTAVDLSATALDRARQHAEQAGVGDRITWERHDLATSFPTGSFDLVSAQFFQSPVALPRADILHAASEAVAPGGAILVVSHAGPPSWTPPDSAGARHVFPSPEDELVDLGVAEGEWEVVRCEVAERDAAAPDGQPGTHIDAVVLARRLT